MKTGIFKILHRYILNYYKLTIIYFYSKRNRRGKTYLYRNLGYVRNEPSGHVGKRVTFERNTFYFKFLNLTRDMVRISGQVQNKPQNQIKLKKAHPYIPHATILSDYIIHKRATFWS